VKSENWVLSSFVREKNTKYDLANYTWKRIKCWKKKFPARS
jgi:hypothetical protein